MNENGNGFQNLDSFEVNNGNVDLNKNANQGGSAPPPKKKAPMAIIIVVALLVLGSVGYLAATGGLDSIFNPDGKGATVSGDKAPPKSPKNAKIDKDFMNVALERTKSNIVNGPSTLPDISKFQGTAFEQDITIGLDSINTDYWGYMGEGIAPFIGSNVNLNTQLDIKSKELALGFSLVSPMINLTDYRFFLAESLIGVKIPDFYSENEYLTINPKTFVDDYNNSMYGEYSPISEEDVNLSQTIEMLFGVMENSSESVIDVEGFSEDVNKLAEELEEKMVVKDEGKDEDGNQLVSYTLSAEDAKEFFRNILELEAALMTDYFDSIAENSYGAIPSYEIDYMKEDLAEAIDEMMTSIDFPDDIVMSYTINKDQHITRIKSDKFTISSQSEYDDEPSEVNISFDVAFNGTDNLSDDISVTIVMEGDDEEITIHFSEVIKNDKDGLGRTIGFDIEMDDITYFALAFDYLWNSKEKTEDNFTAKIEFEVYDDYWEETTAGGVSITGKLNESANEISFVDGLIDIYTDEASLITLTLDYSIKKIEAVTAPGPSNSVSFFDLTEGDILDMMNSAVETFGGGY